MPATTYGPLQQARAYLKFLWRSTNQHGVHSPFVFGLVTRCFYVRKKHPAYTLLSAYRKELLQSSEKIRVKDLGAGSRVFRGEARNLSAMARKTGISSKRARLLNRLVRYLEVETALELGTSLGLGSVAMAAQNEVEVESIEGCPATAAVARRQLKHFGIHNVELREGDFDEVLDEMIAARDFQKEQKKAGSPLSFEEIPDGPGPETGSVNAPPRHAPSSGPAVKTLGRETFSLVYLDGNHQKEATLRYFQKLLPFAHNDSVFIVDDIHWSAEMEEAWEEIKAHPSVKVSIDTFQWGLVFFRREQAKEHFNIRL